MITEAIERRMNIWAASLGKVELLLGRQQNFIRLRRKLKCSINFFLLKFNKNELPSSFDSHPTSMFMYSENETGNYSFPGAQFLHRYRFRECHRL